jgi:hypothetical protein
MNKQVCNAWKIHACSNVCAYLYIYVYSRIHVPQCIFQSTSVADGIRAHVHGIYTYVCICVNVTTYARVCIWLNHCLHMREHGIGTHMCTYIHTGTHTYIHTFGCILLYVQTVGGAGALPADLRHVVSLSRGKTKPLPPRQM